jgi:GH24 family phage-related lysozyme (muramidase)
MIRLKNILETRLKEQKPLGDIIRDTDTDEEHLNVLFIGDSELRQDWSFAKMLLRKKLVLGKIIAKPDISASQMLRLLRSSINAKYDIITIVGAGNSDANKDSAKAIRALEAIYTFANNHNAKVIAVSNPLKRYVKNSESKYPAAVDISEWINSQDYTDDVIDVSRFGKGMYDRNLVNFNIDGHRKIAAMWLNIVKEYKTRDSEKKEIEPEKKDTGIIAPVAIPAAIFSGDLVADADFNSSVTAQATRLLSRLEGYNPMAKWDVNNWRIGIGSSTITTPEGEVIQLGNDRSNRPMYIVTQEDAARDLARRLEKEFIPKTISAIGSIANRLPKGVIAALVSVTYNYGSLPASIRTACRTGDIQKIADAIRAREVDNSGINKKRRNKEANYVLAASKDLVKTESIIKLKSLIKK